MYQPWKLAEGQHAQSLTQPLAHAEATRFLLYLPRGFDSGANRKWPLIVFLHGSGERGADIEKVKLHGPPKQVQTQPDFPFIVVSPQAPANTAWRAEMIEQLLDELLQRLPVDADRVYLTGLSLGGHGTWNIGAKLAPRFAAIAPVCGAGEVRNACQLKSMPIWAFHGDQDTVVSLERDQQMVDAVRACGGAVKFSVYPGVGHDSWTQTYADPALYQWFLQHRRAAAAP